MKKERHWVLPAIWAILLMLLLGGAVWAYQAFSVADWQSLDPSSCSFHRRHRSKQEEFTMAKIKTKTHSGAKKRFKMTASGKVKYQKTNKRHRLTQKDTKRKRIARTVGIADCTNAPALKKLMPYL